MTRRILLIEDEPISQDIIRSLLLGQGYVVDVATDGFGALDRAKAVRYDVALVDYHLPEMDGYALGRLLREQRRDADGAPILIGLTGDRNGLAARRGADAVFRAILPKPIKPSELFDTIERLCGEAAGHAEPGAGEPQLQDPAASHGARQASTALWREQGVHRHPKAFVCPPPAADQAAALMLCFDLVQPEQAELVLLLERHGIAEAVRVARRATSMPLPLVALSADHTDICDLVFKVDEAASWRRLAVLMAGEAAAPVAVASPITAQAPPKPAVVAMPVVASAPAAPACVAAQTAPDGTLHAEIRTLLLGGVAAPLSALRARLEAQLREPEPIVSANASPASHAWADSLAQLDQVLLVTGALADALKAPDLREPEASAFDPAALVEDTLAMIRDAMAPGGPQLDCRIDASVPPRMCGDVHRLGEILLSLMDDACGLHDGGTLTLHLAFRDGARPELALRLRYRPDICADEIGWRRPDAALIGQLRAIRLTTLSRLVALMGGELAPAGEGLFALSVPARREALAGTDADAADREIIAAPIDHAMRDALTVAIGPATVERLTGQLLARITALCDEPAAEAVTRLGELASCAAVLGLPGLAASCAAPEPAGPGRQALQTVLARAQQALGRCRQAAA